MTDRHNKTYGPKPDLASPGQQQCRSCGTPLDPLQAGKRFCDAAACETRRVQEAARAVYKRRWNQYVERQHRGIEQNGPELAAAARMLAVRPGDLNVGVVPRQNRRLAPLPPERRAAFAAHLAEIVAESFANEVPKPGEQRRERSEPPDTPLLAAACATCQGHCCTIGGETHAFMTRDTIDSFRRRFPDLDAAAVTVAYLGEIPDQSVEHSCVFHGPKGCVLDRKVRSELCNAYQCNPKRDLAKRLDGIATDRGVWIAAEDQTDTVVAVYDPDSGYRGVAADIGWSEADPESAAAIKSALLQKMPQKMAEQISPGAIPGLPACSWCGAPIDAQRAAATRCCGSAACEHARQRGIRSGV